MWVKFSLQIQGPEQKIKKGPYRPEVGLYGPYITAIIKVFRYNRPPSPYPRQLRQQRQLVLRQTGREMEEAMIVIRDTPFL